MGAPPLGAEPRRHGLVGSGIGFKRLVIAAAPLKGLAQQEVQVPERVPLGAAPGDLLVDQDPADIREISTTLAQSGVRYEIVGTTVGDRGAFNR